MTKKETPPDCPLCEDHGETFSGHRYFQCGRCRGIYLHPLYYLRPDEERARYETHNNDVNDPAYREFVSPISMAILQRYGPEHAGLDYGAGTGPVITQVLREEGYQVELYDPFFHPNDEVLAATYDFIACCEVIEHFHSPGIEFDRLKNLLKPGGSLFCMTQIYRSDIDFENSYYRNDPTHVFFYREETFEWIRQTRNFSGLRIDNRLIAFSR